MAYDLTGKIKLIQDAQTFSSGFTKREMVVTVEDGKFPQDINLEFLQDKVALLDTVAVGQEVKVSFDIRGREYEGLMPNQCSIASTVVAFSVAPLSPCSTGVS